MSVNAFGALYQSIGTGEPLTSPWNAIQVFKQYCPNGHCDYVRGKLMKVTFAPSGELDTTG